MIEITRTRRIAAKPQAIWDVLADFGTISAWADNVDHSCMLHQGAGGGALGSTRRIQTGSNTVVERIVDFDPPVSLAYDIEGLPKRVRTVRNRWVLTPEGDDETTVALSTTIEIGARPPQRIAERVVSRVMAKQSDVMLAGIARHLESSRG